MAQEYYQIGGYRPHLSWEEYQYDDKKLSQAIAGDASPLRAHGQGNEPIELTLGIKRSGTSHLLLTENQMRSVANALNKPFPRVYPFMQRDFESLSPIYFYNTAEVASKLKFLKPKVIKGHKTWDNSQSNKQYSSENEDGVLRSAYEHGRVFYHVIHDTIKAERYSISDVSRLKSIKVYSFIFTLRTPDTRSKSERLNDPIGLDYGFAEAKIPDIQYHPNSAHHLSSANNRMITIPQSQRLPFVHGTTLILDDMVISERVRELFSQRICSSTQPVILLVHDEEVSKNKLKNFGIDISTWESGLKGLFDFPSTEIKQERTLSTRPGDPKQRSSSSQSNPADNFRRGYMTYNERQNRPRSRSRSPRRSYDQYKHSSSRGKPPSRHPNPSSSRPYAPVYVVDIKQLFTTLMQTSSSSESVSTIGQYLGLSPPGTGWCAGNDAVLVFEVWRWMLSGLPIDDQRMHREKASSSKEQALGTSSTVVGGSSEYDSDQDPNDWATAQGSAPEVGYDSWSDNGESTDSDD